MKSQLTNYMRYLKLLYMKWYNFGGLRMNEWERYFELRKKLFNHE